MSTLALMAALAMFGGCATMHHLGLWSDGGFDSFHGVSFGDSYYDVRTRFPGAQPQTSPYGAEALLLSNIGDAGVHYDSVVYEFTYRGGMQLVMARFSASSTATLYNELLQAFGRPGEGGATASMPPCKSHLQWQFRGGETVSFNGPERRLILLGPGGKPLKQDVELREQSALYGA
ncbi:MAG: hypothetical protein ACREQN_16110 [Candidatus Binataceae bacterium]